LLAVALVDGVAEDTVKLQVEVEQVDLDQLLAQLAVVALLKLHYLFQQLVTQ